MFAGTKWRTAGEAIAVIWGSFNVPATPASPPPHFAKRRRRRRSCRDEAKPNVNDEQPAIDLHRVTVQRGARNILRDITWRVPAGTCAAILGPNGSGKSTLARVILGQIWPTSGSVTVLGQRFGE